MMVARVLFKIPALGARFVLISANISLIMVEIIYCELFDTWPSTVRRWLRLLSICQGLRLAPSNILNNLSLNR